MLTNTVWNTMKAAVEHTNLGGENVLIVELLLYPRHEVIDVLWSRALDWLLYCCAVCPVVFISVRGGGGGVNE